MEQRATHRPAMRQGRCEWVIRLNGNLPTDLSVKFGAGKADLKLAGLTLTRLQVETLYGYPGMPGFALKLRLGLAALTPMD